MTCFRQYVHDVQDQRAVDGGPVLGGALQGGRGILPQLLRERAQPHQVHQPEGR